MIYLALLLGSFGVAGLLMVAEVRKLREEHAKAIADCKSEAAANMQTIRVEMGRIKAQCDKHRKHAFERMARAESMVVALRREIAAGNDTNQ